MNYHVRQPISIWWWVGLGAASLMAALAFLAVSLGLSLILKAGV